MAAPTSGVKPGQSVLVTLCPSEAHRRAAWSAATQLGWPGSPSGVRVVHAMRSRPGSAPTSSVNGRAGGGARYGSPTSGPEVASSSAALSRTDRVSACSAAAPAATSPYSGPSGLRARVGLRANSPHAEAGYRSEPRSSRYGLGSRSRFGRRMGGAGCCPSSSSIAGTTAAPARSPARAPAMLAAALANGSRPRCALYALLNVDELPTTVPSVVRQACTADPYREATVVAFRVSIWPQCGRPPSDRRCGHHQAVRAASGEVGRQVGRWPGSDALRSGLGGLLTRLVPDAVSCRTSFRRDLPWRRSGGSVRRLSPEADPASPRAPRVWWDGRR